MHSSMEFGCCCEQSPTTPSPRLIACCEFTFCYMHIQILQSNVQTEVVLSYLHSVICSLCKSFSFEILSMNEKTSATLLRSCCHAATPVGCIMCLSLLCPLTLVGA